MEKHVFVDMAVLAEFSLLPRYLGEHKPTS